MTANVSEPLVQKVMEACPKFCEALTNEEVATFLKFTNIVDAEPNNIIADIGEVGNEFYLVLEGRVRLMSVEGGNEMDVGRIEVGCLAGEMSFFDRQPRSIRLRSGKKNGVKLLAIPRPMYKRLCVEHSYISVNLLEFVVMSLDKLIRNSSKYMTTLYKHVAGVGYR